MTTPSPEGDSPQRANSMAKSCEGCGHMSGPHYYRPHYTCYGRETHPLSPIPDWCPLRQAANSEDPRRALAKRHLGCAERTLRALGIGPANSATLRYWQEQAAICRLALGLPEPGEEAKSVRCQP